MATIHTSPWPSGEAKTLDPRPRGAGKSLTRDASRHVGAAAAKEGLLLVEAVRSFARYFEDVLSSGWLHAEAALRPEAAASLNADDVRFPFLPQQDFTGRRDDKTASSRPLAAFRARGSLHVYGPAEAY